ncbi:nadph-dependent fmn reductase [Lucifera butyrica]|uniref:Nadph-dependent fmn reductase n=1 Tax=Lucifera butyrica TaxID=1351585 RepID=A0A498R4P5_9FIRM|nr:flavodoxin family protein [Lucifera butyrica]VBB05780.1 nadph-dependent fmn reductase [Lucifera butyrica]
MKKVLIVNGNPDTNRQNFDEYCEELRQRMQVQGNEVKLITLREKKIADCIGCYACWLKTPGICALKDEQEEVLRGYLWADCIVLASPTIMGFVSALIKKANDRMLPLVHPFLKMNNDRMTHYPRYDKEYALGLLLDGGERFDEAIEIIKKVYSKARFIKTMQSPVEEVAYEIDNI